MLSDFDASLKARLGGASLPPKLSAEGYGPVRLGMTLAELEQNLGEKAEQLEELAPGCSNPKFASLPDLNLLVEEGRITRIDASLIPNVYDLKHDGNLESFLSTNLNRKSVGNRYTEGRIHLLNTPDGNRAFIIEEENGVPVSLGAAFFPAAEYPEGCL